MRHAASATPRTGGSGTWASGPGLSHSPRTPAIARARSFANTLHWQRNNVLSTLFRCQRPPTRSAGREPRRAGARRVIQGGGSFGRHLFADAAFEAAAISKAIGKPFKLMWHRTDNFRQGRVHPMCTSRVRVTYLGDNVLAFDQRHTSVATDFSHGLGELVSATLANVPEGDFLGYAQTIFSLTANVPYNFAAVTQLLNEIDTDDATFNTSSVRNIYSPEVTSREPLVDSLARVMRQDPYQFRRAFARDARMQAVLGAAAKAASWRRAMRPGTAQWIGVHHEYKSYAACVAEIDGTPTTVTGRSRTVMRDRE
jgi:isoquinoline 1-oxidoreductase subunit beta